jgi:hypothetical protein
MSLMTAADFEGALRVFRCRVPNVALLVQDE